MLGKTCTSFLALAALAHAQSITGTLLGTVLDSSKLPIAGAQVVARQSGTGAERVVNTDMRGEFVLAGLQPGMYGVTVSMAGFKSVERTGVNLPASETLPLGDLVLEVGETTEKITVTAEGATVQTASSERSGLVTSQQVDTMAIRGRNITSLLQLLPGVVDRGDEDALSRGTNFSVLGGRQETNSVVLDGMTLNAMANANNLTISVSQDAVAEVKVLLGNYQAEYGRLSGANIQLITKSGTREFHGLGSYFKRHEQFNANNFFNNQQGQPKPRYRFNTWTYNVGGPAYIPGKFNKEKDKLFFFWAQEIWPLTRTQPITQRTVPTELERAGNFTQSLDLNNARIVVRDPANAQPFAGNVVPASRLDASGLALLKVFPLPNFADRAISAGRYNYVFQAEQETPIRTQTLKLDYNANPRNLFFANYSWSSEDVTNMSSGNWQQMPRLNRRYGKMVSARYQRILGPSALNEFTFGFSRRPEIDLYEDDVIARNQRDKAGFRAGQFTPSSNPLNIIPNATFGGVTNAANLTVEPRFPHTARNDTFVFIDNFTKTSGRHTMKAGFYLDYLIRDFTGAVTFNGAFDFGRNVNNPLDTNYAYSNAALGVFNNYREANGRPYIRARYSNFETFAQDNWRVTPRLTLDLGVRFYWAPPGVEADNRMSSFLTSRYDPAKRVRFIEPARIGNRRVGINPITGQEFPAALIGALVPGAGDPYNGMALASDKTVPRSLAKNPGLLPAPRIGFAYDVFGNGKTAVRGGFGLFYNREGFQAVILPYSTQSPIVDTPVVTFGSIATLFGSTGFLFPQAVNGLDPTGATSRTMNFSLSVQQSVAKGTVVDVGYVGSLGRNLLWSRNVNSIPFGTNFDPANADPSNPSTPLPQTFLRPYFGYDNILIREYASSSNYHSLQVQANRRFSRGVQFGMSWTWSKAMDYNSGEAQQVSNLVSPRVWNYGLSDLDRTHVLKTNWLWDVPAARTELRPLRAVLHNWQVSGILSFVSGQPLGVGFSQVTPTDITGSPTDGPRITVTGNPVLPKSERAFSRNFRTDVFALPARGTWGNAARTLLRGPGMNNWDMAVLKSFPLHERVRLQFRWELYNAFNHTQFSALDTTARFDAQGRQVNARFGEFTAARSPRQMQFALRCYF